MPPVFIGTIFRRLFYVTPGVSTRRSFSTLLGFSFSIWLFLSRLRLHNKTLSNNAPPNTFFKHICHSFLPMLTRLSLIRGSRPLLNSMVCKALFGSTPDTRDPLALMRDDCHKRKLCDEHGFRRPGAHWVFSVAVTPDDMSQVCIVLDC
jgi:hypothetical protein